MRANPMARGVASALLLAVAGSAMAQGVDDEQIRRVVAPMLAAKDQQIRQLEARIRELEQQQARAGKVREEQLSDLSNEQPASKETDTGIGKQVSTLGEKVAALQAAQEEAKLGINGFFSVYGRSDNQTDRSYELGPVEVDLTYEPSESFAASAALVWEEDTAHIGVAVLDYHFFDSSIPVRGRIFTAQGLHFQAGRFDLPFGTDYQYFASPDRLTFSAPVTTDRIQNGGLNSDGVRVYGSEGMLNYAAYWTNSAYEDDGASLGGRLGLMFGRDPFRLHHVDSAPVLEIGASMLRDQDAKRRKRRDVYGVDLTMHYGMFKLDSEWSWRREEDPLLDAFGVDFGNADARAWHVTLYGDMSDILEKPVTLFARYGNWNPSADAVIDSEDGTAYWAGNLDQLAVGLNYSVNDNFRVKFEYADSLGTHTDEPTFEHRIGTAQLVVSF